MHPEADAFLDAIFDHPDDDTPRLVYADWLQEHGQENYAQFIRLQCAAAREKLWSDEANRLWEEIGRVWNRLDVEWFPATREAWLVEDWRSELLDAVHFERGFPRPTFAATDDQIVQCGSCWPWLSAVTAIELNPNVDAWRAFSAPHLRRLRHLRLSEAWLGAPAQPPASPNILNEFLRRPHLCKLTVLDLVNILYLSPENVEVLLTAPNLASVEELRISVTDDYTNDVLDSARPQLQTRFARVQEYG